MDGDNQEIIYCENDAKDRVFCDNCDKLCTQRFSKNLLKSGTHISINSKRQQFFLKKSYTIKN